MHLIIQSPPPSQRSPTQRIRSRSCEYVLRFVCLSELAQVISFLCPALTAGLPLIPWMDHVGFCLRTFAFTILCSWSVLLKVCRAGCLIPLKVLFSLGRDSVNHSMEKSLPQTKLILLLLSSEYLWKYIYIHMLVFFPHCAFFLFWNVSSIWLES